MLLLIFLLLGHFLALLRLVDALPVSNVLEESDQSRLGHLINFKLSELLALTCLSCRLLETQRTNFKWLSFT
jgi:hypothetical protein